MTFSGCSGAGDAATPPILPGALGFAAASFTVAQTAGSATITVSRTGGFNGAVSVAYATSNGTATAGADYTAVSGTLNWADMDSSPRNIPVPISSAIPFYGTRTFTVTLSSAGAGATLGAIASTTISITGSLATQPLPGTLAFSAASTAVAQPLSGGTMASISVARTGGSSGAVSVAYASSNGTATAGTDYAATSGTLNWADGDAAAKTISVPISSASPFNGARVFTLALSAPTGGATVGSISSNSVTITGAWIAPSSYSQFDFSKWKLQLPIDQYGGTGGLNNIQYANVEVQSAQLTTGFTDAYFYADKTGDVIFTAPSNGAVTTPGVGSDHTRSELRELYTGAGADSNSDWNSTIGGTMTATCRVLSVSVDADEGTIAQIHGQTYVFMLLMYRPALKDIAVDIYATNTSTSGHTRTSMVTGVNLGDTVTYSVQYSGNTITATVNGVIKSFPIDSSWAGSPMYFKLGAYHAAPNIGNPAGDQTQVSFSAFAVSH